MRREKYVKKDVDEDDVLWNYKQPKKSVTNSRRPSLNWQMTARSKLSRWGSLKSIDKRSQNASPIGPKLSSKVYQVPNMFSMQGLK